MVGAVWWFVFYSVLLCIVWFIFRVFVLFYKYRFFVIWVLWLRFCSSWIVYYRFRDFGVFFCSMGIGCIDGFVECDKRLFVGWGFWVFWFFGRRGCFFRFSRFKRVESLFFFFLGREVCVYGVGERLYVVWKLGYSDFSFIVVFYLLCDFRLVIYYFRFFNFKVSSIDKMIFIVFLERRLCFIYCFSWFLNWEMGEYIWFESDCFYRNVFLLEFVCVLFELDVFILSVKL